MPEIDSLWPIGKHFQKTAGLFEYIEAQNVSLVSQTHGSVMAILCEKRIPRKTAFDTLSQTAEMVRESVDISFRGEVSPARNASEIYKKKTYEYYITDAKTWYELPLFEFECNDVFPIKLTIEESLAAEAGIPELHSVSSLRNFQNIFKSILNTEKVSYVINRLIELQSVDSEDTQDNQLNDDVFQGKLVYASNLIHVKQLEKREREFSKTCGKGAQIIIISNNLTCDSDVFLDEIRNNLLAGVSYTYIVPDKLEDTVETIRDSALQAQMAEGNPDIKMGSFSIIPNAKLFVICPIKYTVAIYDKGNTEKLDSDALKVFFSAQDYAEHLRLYYFEMSYPNAKIFYKRIKEQLLSKNN